MKGYESSKNNIKAVAYMLDIDTWSTFGDNDDKILYAIGGPTLEMFINSYLDTHDVLYKAEAKSEVGYQISIDGGKIWGDYYYNVLDVNSYNNLYVINGNLEAYGMWLASPSVCNVNKIFHTGDTGRDINSSTYNNKYIGFRPIICVKSDTLFFRNSDGIFKLK